VGALVSSSSFIPGGADHEPCLLGSKCAACHTVVFPKMPVCPACLSFGTMSKVEIGRTARLYSHTIARIAPHGFKAPLFQAFVVLPEGPRIFALVGAECPVEPGVLDDGMQMRLVIEPLADTPENRNILTYKYVPAPLRSGGKAGHA
jgi:uncharacterized OB-fold protein